MPLTAAAEKEIDGYLEGGIDGEDGRMVSKKDRILQILEESDELYYAVLNPKHVGVDPADRDEDDMSDNGVHSRGVGIVKAGWSFQIAQSETVCMGDDQEEHAVAKHTMANNSRSPRLSQLQASTIFAGSLGAGHCNQFLCCVIDEVPSEFEALTEKGLISQRKLFEDKGIEKAVKGLRWAVIRRANRKRFPNLGRFIQSALNIKHHIAKGELA